MIKLLSIGGGKSEDGNREFLQSQDRYQYFSKYSVKTDSLHDSPSSMHLSSLKNKILF